MKNGLKLYKSDILVIMTFSLAVASMFMSIGVEVMSYLDEMMELTLCIVIVIAIAKKRYTSNEYIIIFLSSILFSIGILGNVLYKYQTNISQILIDVIATFKGIIYFLGIRGLNINGIRSKRVITRLYNVFLTLVIIIFPFAVINLFFDIGMSHESVYGIRGFTFLYSAEGNFSLIFYVIVTCLVCNIAVKGQFRGKLIGQSIIIMLLWASSLRSRAIGFAILFFVMCYVFIRQKDSVKKRIHIWKLIPIGLLLLWIANDKIVYYFVENKTTARYNLLYYGLVTLKRFFPIGSGFGTYGSAVAADHYSPLYIEYGFERIHGLSFNNRKFANDGLWGEIFGQFGFIGTIIFMLVFYLIFRSVYKQAVSKYDKFAVLYILLIILGGSIGTKTVMHFTITPCFILLGLLSNYFRSINYKRLEISEKKEVYAKIYRGDLLR